MCRQIPFRDILVTGSEAEKEDEDITYYPRSLERVIGGPYMYF